VTPRTVQVVVFVAPGGGTHVAQDAGQVLAGQLSALAELFAQRLVDLAAPEHAAPMLVTASQLAQLLDLHDLSPEHVDLVEAQALDSADAVRWSLELAERVARAIERDGSQA